MDLIYLKERGVLTFTELIAGCLGKEYFTNEKRLSIFFNFLDLEKKGGITTADQQLCFERFGRSLSKEKINKFMIESDTNGDGVVAFMELITAPYRKNGIS